MPSLPSVPVTPDPLTATGRKPLSAAALTASLPSPYVYREERTTYRTARLLDTYDGMLSGAQQLLVWAGEHVVWLEGQQYIAGAGKGGKTFSRQHLNPPLLQQKLSELPTLRALVPLANVDMKLRRGRLLDDEQKTVVRLEILVLRADQTFLCLYRTEALKGYEAAHALFAQYLQALLARDEPVVDTQPVASFLRQIQALAPITRAAQALDLPRPEVLPSGAGIKAVMLKELADYLLNARHNEAGIVAEVDTECLHQYRVNLRRIRSLISLFNDVLEPATQNALGERYARLMKPTNAVRDLDVLLLERKAFRAMLPEFMHAAFDHLMHRLAAKRRSAARKLNQHLTSADYMHTARALSFTLCHGNNLLSGAQADLPVEVYAQQVLTQHYTRLHKKIAVLDQDSEPDIHALRIRFKRLRYCLEFFQQVNSKTGKAQSARLRKLQNLLGDFNDCCVQIGFFQNLLSEDQRRKSTHLNTGDVEVIGALMALRHHRKEELKQQIRVQLQGIKKMQFEKSQPGEKQ